jgi:hypothetical protein
MTARDRIARDTTTRSIAKEEMRFAWKEAFTRNETHKFANICMPKKQSRNRPVKDRMFFLIYRYRPDGFISAARVVADSIDNVVIIKDRDPSHNSAGPGSDAFD